MSAKLLNMKKPETVSIIIECPQVLKAERDLLHTSRFDLNVVHSYKFIMQYVKQIKGERDLAQVAWSFYNDR